MKTIKQLNDGYKHNEQLYNDFLTDNLNDYAEYFSNDVYRFKDAPHFPFYIASGSDEQKTEEYKKAIRIIRENYLQYDRDLYLDGRFWHSLLVQVHREYILEHYPTIKGKYKNFLNIVLKDFDWENYIYKSVFLAEYIEDSALDDVEADRFIELVIRNLDVLNYILKYEVFRNSNFLFTLLEIIEEENYSKIFKKQIKDRPDLGSDERYGRRVIFELNKSYPTIMVPYLTKEELRKEVKEALSLYYNEEEPESQEKKSLLGRIFTR